MQDHEGLAKQYSAVANALQHPEFISIINKNPDCTISVSFWQDPPVIRLRSYLNSEEYDIRDIATSVNLHDYEYSQEDELLNLGTCKIVRIIDVQQPIQEDEIELLEAIGKVHYTDPERYLLC